MEENITENNLRESEDQKQLRLLALFHYIIGGLLVFLACMPLIHLGIGIAIKFIQRN